MITLRLFAQSDPVHEIDRRSLGQDEGEIVIGRDQDADWVIADPSKTLSRRHCVVALRNGVVTLRDDSVNGVFLHGERLPSKIPTPISPGQTVSIGAFLIQLGLPPKGEERDRAAATSLAIRPMQGDSSAAGSLLDAFCGGAQIDSSVLSGEDPNEVMRRLGEIYRQMVLGLGDLMNERTRIKARYGLEWTTVQAADNNPFRWAPPQRVAIDLLQASQDGFLNGEAAIRSSFEDLAEHQLGLDAGSQAAMERLLAELSPEAIQQEANAGPFRLKKKTEILWAEFERRYAKVRDDARDEREGSMRQAFRDAYRARSVEQE